MNKQTFTVSMAYLQKLFGHIVEDDIRPFYWDAVKGWSDERFKAAITEIIKTFVPTSQVPFPVPAHFYKAAPRVIPEYKPQIEDKSEPATAEQAREIIERLVNAKRIR